jgi:hypothetical protein
MINLAGRARRRFAGREGSAHVVVGENIAGTDDHRGGGKPLVRSATIPSAADSTAQRKNGFL